ncbi:ABC transporter ATP-binding protein [Parablautia sp. Marseille-Q6255]|uniref:ABC transporter ATP-binding protein n=1 Tax=Parablautia sp. Marseille-Q6255 TaxID=3039593 RepID=UPI0024BD17D4|nr:ABC transporter ATP-binding protein [Parablautia sp. Marseille-Q6255]
MSELAAKGIVKTYGTNEVLHQVDLALESGKIYGLIGRNGAGKTTLLSILTAQNPATQGSVTYNGETVWENPSVLSHLCFSRELNPMTGNNANPMKVKEYLKIAETFFPYWDKEMAKRLVGEFHLDVKKRISKLSKGMLSMVTIIVALASKAEFTFLDEPVAGLDVVARERFYELLVEELSETGRTFVVSTHIIEEAADVFEEVIMVDQGRILLKENTQELLERSYHVSGHEDEVERATAGLERHHEERLGRSRGVTVLLEKGQKLPEQYDVSIQKPSLQKIFVALCGEE